MTDLLARFFSDESGATAIEYAMIAVGVAVAIAAAVEAVSTSLQDKFNLVANAFN